MKLKSFPKIKTKNLLILLLILVSFISSRIFTNYYSKSFLVSRVPFHPISPESLGLAQDLLATYNEEDYRSLHIASYAGTSTDSENLAKYFLPNGQSKITCGEFGSTLSKTGQVDVQANYFNLLTKALPVAKATIDPDDYTFESIVSFKPEQTFAGTSITYKHHLSEYLDKGFWLELTLPFVSMTNNLNITEEIINPGTGVEANKYSNMLNALKQADWDYGKLYDGPRSDAGIGDVQARLGYTYFKEEKYALTTFWGLILPMGGKPTGEYLFDTNLGSNGHSGIVSGASLMFRIWHKKDKSIFWLLDTTGTFFAQNKQMRSLDLVGKPWSRYLWLYKDRTTTTTSPGVNALTQLCDVSAGSTRNLNLGFMFNQGGLRLSAGYHFHNRDREIVELSKDWSTDTAVAAIFKDDLSMVSANTPISKNGADIKNYRNVLNDKNSAGVETYKPLVQSDLDLDSASAPSSTVHTLYAGIDYYWPDRVHPLTLGFGGSYDAAGDNASLDRFLFWARLGINF